MDTRKRSLITILNIVAFFSVLLFNAASNSSERGTNIALIKSKQYHITKVNGLEYECYSPRWKELGQDPTKPYASSCFTITKVINTSVAKALRERKIIHNQDVRIMGYIGTIERDEYGGKFYLVPDPKYLSFGISISMSNSSMNPAAIEAFLALGPSPSPKPRVEIIGSFTDYKYGDPYIFAKQLTVW